jgi:hypothetical protein
MKLTSSTPLKQFADTISDAALQSSVEALGERSHAGALGSLESLLYSICQQHPKALAVVNEYIERHTPHLICEHAKAEISPSLESLLKASQTAA